MNITSLKNCLLFLIVMSLLCSSAHAQDYSINQTVKGRLIGIADSIIRSTMSELHIPGVSFTMIHRDSVLSSSSYGWASLENRTELTGHSMFDMGSVPKSLVAVAIMQLNEAGKIKLDQDINLYLKDALKFKFKNGKPITIHHLLTHTAGFEDISNIGSSARNPNETMSLRSFLKWRKPQQVLEAGEAVIYSNYGYGLLGLIIEQVTNLAFHKYMSQYLFDPLQMNHSTFDHRHDSPLMREYVDGYEWNGNSHQLVPMAFTNNLPAGGLRSSTSDMGRFVSMLLNGGTLDGIRVLDSTSVVTMLSKQYSPHDLLPGLCYAAREVIDNGRRTIGQNGGWQGFNTDLLFDPVSGLGIIVASNLDDYSTIANTIWKEILREASLTSKSDKPYVRGVTDLTKYEGIYRSNIYSRSTLLKLGTLFGFYQEYSISAIGDTLLLNGNPLLPIADNVFERSTGAYRVAFKEIDGAVVRMSKGNAPYDSYEKINALEQPRFYLIAGTITFVSLLIYSLASIRWAIKQTNPETKKIFDLNNLPVLTHRLLIGIIVFVAMFIVLFPLTISNQSFYDLQFGMPEGIKATLLLPFLVVIMTIANGLLLPFIWKRMIWSTSRRILFSTAMIATIVLVFIMIDFNLIGFNF